MDEPFDYDKMVLDELKRTTDEEELLHAIMRKNRGLPNPWILKEKIREHVNRPRN